jgi:hypothetical protein
VRHDRYSVGVSADDVAWLCYLARHFERRHVPGAIAMSDSVPFPDKIYGAHTFARCVSRARIALRSLAAGLADWLTRRGPRDKVPFAIPRPRKGCRATK